MTWCFRSLKGKKLCSKPYSIILTATLERQHRLLFQIHVIYIHFHFVHFADRSFYSPLNTLTWLCCKAYIFAVFTTFCAFTNKLKTVHVFGAMRSCLYIGIRPLPTDIWDSNIRLESFTLTQIDSCKTRKRKEQHWEFNRTISLNQHQKHILKYVRLLRVKIDLLWEKN